jgi:hypothetical protein
VIRLSERPGHYDGVSLKYCGLLFLSTPHSGSTLADQNETLVGWAGAAFRIRSDDIVNILRTASDVSAESRRKFENLSAKPPFFCLCEGKKTLLAPLPRTVSKFCQRARKFTEMVIQAIVVTQESACLAGQPATLMEGYDHRTVARFENKFEQGYRLVVDRLGKIKQALSGLKTQTSFLADNVRAG